MIFGARTEEQKKIRELNRECRELKKELLTAKIDRKQVDIQMHEFRDALELGGELRKSYVDSQEHFALARRAVMDMMDTMSEIPKDNVKQDLNQLNFHLANLCHPCGIREDDLDFKSTVEGLSNMEQNFEKVNFIMLRSELENLHALLEDTSEWRSPNFFALAYYFLHEAEKKDKIAEMENENRNRFLRDYLEEHLMEMLMMEASCAGCIEKVENMIQEYIYN